MGFWHESITKTEGECFIKIEVCLLFTPGGDKKLGPMLLCHQPMSGRQSHCIAHRTWCNDERSEPSFSSAVQENKH